MNKIKRILALALALLGSLTLPAQAAPSSFVDVPPDAWYYNVVMDITALGAIEGDGLGSFFPNDEITAVEFAKITMDLFPDSRGLNYYDIDVEATRAQLEAANPGHWANEYILAALLRGADQGMGHIDWLAPVSRSDMTSILGMLYLNSDVQPQLRSGEMVLNLINDYYTANIHTDINQPAILWAYSNGLLGGDESKNFNPQDTLTRAEACAILSRLYYPERRLSVDWDKARSNFSAGVLTSQDEVDFTGKTRVRFSFDVAYDYCRALEEEIGIQIFYMAEFTEKEAGLLDHAMFWDFPMNEEYFQLVLEELQKMKAAYDRYPEGFLKEMISKKNANRGTEIILSPYTFEGVAYHGIHLYDESSGAKKVDQIYYTGIGDEQYYSHEMGHMVMSNAAILGGWSAVTGEWEAMNARARTLDYVSMYAMSSRPEDWADTWAYLWHQPETVGLAIGMGGSVLQEKVAYMTALLDRCYDTIQADQLPWSDLV